MLQKPTRHPLRRGLKIGNAWLLFAFLAAFLPDIRVEAGGLPTPWIEKATVTPHSGTAGASVFNDMIYLIGGVGDGWLDSKANSMFDPVLNKWEGRHDMPEARSFVSTAVVEGIIYAIGGATGGLTPVAKSSLYAYDPESDSWTTKKDLPRPTYGCMAGAVDGIIYAIGGAYAVDSMRTETIAYNPATDEWTTLAPCPVGGLRGVTVYEGLIYTFGGVNKEDRTVSGAVCVYDPKSNSWTKKTDMPTARSACGSSLVGGKIYVIGGYQVKNTALATVEVYDPVNDTWESKGNMPETSTMHAQAAVEGRIYVMGGTSDWVVGGQSNWEYNPSLDPPAPSAWTEKEKLPFGRFGGATSELDGVIYLMGGLTSGEPTYYNTFYNQVYDPATNSWSTKKHMPTGRAFLASAEVDGVIYAMGGGYPLSLDTVEAYDTRTNSWTTKKCLPKPCAGSNAAAVDGTIYFVGGNESDSLCYAYSPSADQWTVKNPRPEGGTCAVVAYRGLIYTFGGGDSVKGATPSVYVYDPQTDQWTKKKNMPTARTGLRVYVVFGKFYAIGGTQTGDSALASVEMYDPIEDKWALKSPMPLSASGIQGADVDGKIYVMAGTSDWTTGGEANWEYNPALDTVTIVSAVARSTMPTGFALEQNYPNPFNPRTVISGQWPVASVVRLVVYDVLGREVATVADGRYPAGRYSFTFDASGLASGVYFYRLQAGSISQTKQMILLK